MAQNHDTGRLGEDLAAGYLLDNGFTILHRNWRTGRYEIDIIASDGETIRFIEVKCRQAGGLTGPQDAMTASKFRNMARAAQTYIEQYAAEQEVRFDMVAVLLGGNSSQIEYTPDVWVARW